MIGANPDLQVEYLKLWNRYKRLREAARFALKAFAKIDGIASEQMPPEWLAKLVTDAEERLKEAAR